MQLDLAGLLMDQTGNIEISMNFNMKFFDCKEKKIFATNQGAVSNTSKQYFWFL